MDNIEELVLEDGLELELVKRYRNSVYSVPAVTVGERTMYYNSLALAIVPDRIKWFTTNEYIIGLPAVDGEKNGYAVRKGDYGYAASCVPAEIRKIKKLKNGTYQVYKYKNGFAFKRYEMLSDVG